MTAHPPRHRKPAHRKHRMAWTALFVLTLASLPALVVSFVEKEELPGVLGRHSAVAAVYDARADIEKKWRVFAAKRAARSEPAAGETLPQQQGYTARERSGLDKLIQESAEE